MPAIVSSIKVGASAPAAAASALSPTADAYFNGFTTLVGALVGATVAFLFQIWFASRQEHKANLLNAHKILAFLMQQTNTVMLIQKDYVGAHQKHPLRFLSIPATTDFDPDSNVFDVNTLSLLLPTSESRSIMYDLWLAQSSYMEAMRAWNVRSHFHNQEVQPRLAEGLGDQEMVSVDEVKKVLGLRVYKTITGATDSSLDLLKRTFQKLEKANMDFRAYVVTRFKSKDFTEFDFPEKYGIYQNDEPAPMPPESGPTTPNYRWKFYYSQTVTWSLGTKA